MSVPSVTSKLPSVHTTIFTIMSGLANQYNTINPAQGFPDYLMSKELIKLVKGAMKKNCNQYFPCPIGWRVDGLKTSSY